MYSKRILRLDPRHPRHGGVLVLAAGLMVLVFAFAAFTVDIGFIAVTKSQLQNAADSGAHAASMELQRSFGPGADFSNETARWVAEEVSSGIVGSHRSGDLDSSPLCPEEDMRFGHRAWNPETGDWEIAWGVEPFNAVEVTARRSHSQQTALPLFFARIIGHDDAEVAATATAVFLPGGGFNSPVGDPTNRFDVTSTVHILPIAVDLQTWDAFIAAAESGSGGFPDSYHYSNWYGEVFHGSDGIPELNIYPDQNSSLPPGNRGTVDLGSPNNSTSDLVRQIEHGLNAYDFSFFPNNEIRVDQGPLYLNGDTGISAGIASSLQAIEGRITAIPIFTEVSGNGNNAVYTIVKFVGARVMRTKLTGGPTKRYLYVEPAPFAAPQVFRMDGPFSSDSILAGPFLVN